MFKGIVWRVTPSILALATGIGVMFGAAYLSYQSSGSTNPWIVFAPAAVVYMLVLVVASSVIKPKKIDEFVLSAQSGGIREIAQYVLDKYELHIINARSSLVTLLALTVSCMLIIVFARYFLVIDQFLSSQAVSMRNSTPYCDMLDRYGYIGRDVFGGAFTDNDPANVQATYNRIDQLGEKCHLELANERQFAIDTSKKTNITSDTEAFWPVLLLRASVLAFMLFIMFFFIRNYQYETAVANRYFAIFASLLASPTDTATIKEIVPNFDAGDIRFGNIRTSSLEEIISLPRSMVEAWMASRGERVTPTPKDSPKEPRRQGKTSSGATLA